MPRLIIQTDDGQSVQTVEFSAGSEYALNYMPSCPQHVGMNTLLNQVKRGLKDACVAQRGEAQLSTHITETQTDD